MHGLFITKMLGNAHAETALRHAARACTTVRLCAFHCGSKSCPAMVPPRKMPRRVKYTRKTMPYTLIWEPRGVYKKFSGLVTGAELLRSVSEVANSFAFDEALYEVSDYLGADGTDFSQDALNEVRAMRIGSFQRNRRIKVAIVTLDTDIQQRIYSTIAARMTLHQTKVFSTLAQANEWTGRSPASD